MRIYRIYRTPSYIFDKLAWPLVLIASGLILLWVIVSAITAPEHDFQYSHSVDNGVIKKIYNCKAGKYSYRCDIRTTKGFLYDVDVTNYPDDGLNVGDSISYEYHYSAPTDKAKVMWCRNKLCIHRYNNTNVSSRYPDLYKTIMENQ